MMVLFLRHGRTAWNEAGRIQGRTDVGLSAAGRAVLRGRRLPLEGDGWDWHVSPLRRARETAELLGAPVDPRLEPRLVELAWGEWEGALRAGLVARFGEAYTANAARGLDFRPPGGESTRELQARLGEWLGEVAERGRPAVAVTHKGVVQSALALATGWDLLGRAPHRLAWDRAHRFRLEAAGPGLEVDALNLPLLEG
jgi:2,3-bisphosphoglycerate-dependent phosphoglycerate mutase